MNDFLKNNINKVVGSFSIISVIQFIGQMHDYLSDGKLDSHEIEQMVLSATSGIQLAGVCALVGYFKFIKKN